MVILIEMALWRYHFQTHEVYTCKRHESGMGQNGQSWDLGTWETGMHWVSHHIAGVAHSFKGLGPGLRGTQDLGWFGAGSLCCTNSVSTSSRYSLGPKEPQNLAGFYLGVAWEAWKNTQNRMYSIIFQLDSPGIVDSPPVIKDGNGKITHLVRGFPSHFSWHCRINPLGSTASSVFFPHLCLGFF